MADHHQILRDLQSRKNTEENLNRMSGLFKDASYRFSLISFAFHDMTFFEGLLYRNEENPYSDLIDALDALKKEWLSGNAVSFCKIADMRTENRKRMETLTKAVDLFSLLEYVLNRLEHRFIAPLEPAADQTDQAETDKIMSFLSRQDRDYQNLYLYRLLEQLPVRMTKNRFFETVKDRLSIYKGSDVSAFDGILESALSASCAFVKNEEISGYGDLQALFRELSAADLSAMDRTAFESLEGRLHEIGERINSDMDCSQALQNVLNAFGAVVISSYEGLAVPKEQEHALTILKTVTAAFGSDDPDLSAAYTACEALEGTLEEAGEQYQELLGVMESLENRFVFDDADAKRIGVLLSNSSYAEPDGFGPLSGTMTDETLFKKRTEELIGKLSAFFSGLPRPLVRASMARVFSILPPRFTDQEALEAYISESLSGCSDTAEKLGVFELLDGIMGES